MSTENFSILSRYSELWSRLSELKTNPKLALFDAIAWFLTFSAYIYPIDAFPVIRPFLVIANVVFLIRLAVFVDKAIRPPTEIFIALFFLFAFCDTLIIKSCLTNTILQPSFFFKTLHISLTSLLVLIFSLILIRNSKGRGGVLFVAFLICIPALEILASQYFFLLIALQVVFFLYLLRKTSWLEELTKAELYISLPILYFIFTGFTKLNIYGFQSEPFSDLTLWYTWPKLLHIVFRIYLVVLFIKIPIVLIYNFASLSRKLKISRLFQSTLPQLIQLCLLLIIFYAFVAGWQAEKTRKAIWKTFEKITSGEVVSSAFTRTFKPLPSKSIQIPGYKPFFLPEERTQQGIIQLDIFPGYRSSKYFLFREIKNEDGEHEITYLKVDSVFMQICSENIFVLAGTQLLGYPYTPGKVETYFYDLINKMPFLWGRDDKNFYIFPFGLIPHKPEWQIQTALKEYKQDSPDLTLRANNQIISKNYIPAGRLITPIFDSSFNKRGFFTFDILFVPNLGLFTSTLSSYVLLLIILFFLINTVVTKRMVTFGAEINQMIVQKFGQLKDGIREISMGNLNYKVKIDGRDEFVELAGHFNQMGDKLKESIADAREKERLTHELTIARKVQLDLLPNKLPNVPGFQIAATLETANEVGGDFYDVIELAKHRFLFTVGDVSGKGTSAAFYMAQCISLIRYSPQFTDKPEEIAFRLNEYFSDSFIDKQIFVTAILGIIDVKTETITFIRAGHTNPLLVKADKETEVLELNPNGIGLGLQKNRDKFIKALEIGTQTLQTEDMIVFYTDGIEEAAIGKQGLEEEMSYYSIERLKDKLSESRSLTANKVIDVIRSDIKSFYGDASLVDDYTLLVIKKC